ncbi:hypothetical protein TELCIR_18818 [Teladorsagia circumcincta]|uniref:Uncharacterized protein n=1 Tax=Teladorsagia circumcincta TaxID=45464 RepID=A0A2G9TP48_TELCI|nr:hypothetical protein TELCIR_18818 [Teladorsagia circumcincta]
MAEKVLLKYQYSAPKLFLANGNNCTKPDTYVVHDGAILYKCVAAPIRAKRSRTRSEDEAMMSFENTTELVNATTAITEDPTTVTAGITTEFAANTTATSTTITEYATKSTRATAAMMPVLTNVTSSSEHTSTSAVTTDLMEGINGTVYSTTNTPEEITTAAATEITVQPNKTSLTTEGKSVEGTVATTELLTTVLLDLKSKSNPLKAQLTAGTLENATLAEVLTKPLKAPPTIGVTMALSETTTAFGHSAEPSEAITTKATIAPSKNRTAVVFLGEPFKVTMATEATVASSANITAATEASIMTSQVTSATEGATVSLESRVTTTELLTTVLLHSKVQLNLLKARRAPDSLGNSTAPELSTELSEATTTTGATVVSSETIMAVELTTGPFEATTTRGATVVSSETIMAVELTTGPFEATTTRGATVAVERSIKLSEATTTKATNPPSGNKTAVTFSSEASKATATNDATIVSDEDRTTTEAPVMTPHVTTVTEGAAGTLESRKATTEPLTTVSPHKSQPNLLKAQRAADFMGNTTTSIVSNEPFRATPSTEATTVSSQATTAKAAIAPFGNTTAIEFLMDPSEATTITGDMIGPRENRTTIKAAIVRSHVTVAAGGPTGTVENTTTTITISGCFLFILDGCFLLPQHTVSGYLAAGKVTICHQRQNEFAEYDRTP